MHVRSLGWKEAQSFPIAQSFPDLPPILDDDIEKAQTGFRVARSSSEQQQQQQQQQLDSPLSPTESQGPDLQSSISNFRRLQSLSSEFFRIQDRSPESIKAYKSL